MPDLRRRKSSGNGSHGERSDVLHGQPRLGHLKNRPKAGMLPYNAVVHPPSLLHPSAASQARLEVVSPPPYPFPMGIGWTKWKIHEEWQASLPDRYDPAKAAAEADADGVTRDYENSYDMHHKVVEATREEVMELIARQEKAQQGLIVWDEQLGRLRDVEP